MSPLTMQDVIIEHLTIKSFEHNISMLFIIEENINHATQSVASLVLSEVEISSNVAGNTKVSSGLFSNINVELSKFLFSIMMSFIIQVCFTQCNICQSINGLKLYLLKYSIFEQFY